MVWPLSTPGGTLSITFPSAGRTPRPLHLGHGFFTTAPAPPQVAQVEEVRTWPMKVLRTWPTTPAPLHVGQVSGWEPPSLPVPPHESHSSIRPTAISFCRPVTTSLRLRL